MKSKIIGIILLVLLPLGGYFIYTIFIDNGEPINLEQSTQQVIEDVKKVRQQQEVYNLISIKNLDEAYLDAHIQDIANRNRVPENVIKFMFGTILLEDADLFIQTFDTETISKDFFEVENPDKIVVATEMMDRISRSGKLNRVGVINVRGSIGQEITTHISLGYNDQSEVKVPIRMKLLGDAHGEDNLIYYITSSVWDIIDQIEGKTEQ